MPAFRSASWAFGDSPVVALPAGVVAGDLLLAVRHEWVWGNNSFTDPAGWTPVGGRQTISGNSAQLYYKAATGSEPASYTFSGTDVGGVLVAAFSDAETSTPPTFTWGGASDTTGTAPTVTAPAGSILAVFFAWLADSWLTGAGTSGWTNGVVEMGDYGADAGVAGALGTKAITTAGTTGATSAVRTGAQRNHGFSVVVAAGPTWSLWNGTTEQPLTATVWNGTAEVAVGSVETV